MWMYTDEAGAAFSVLHWEKNWYFMAWINTFNIKLKRGSSWGISVVEKYNISR